MEDKRKLLGYATFSSLEEAKRISKILLEKRLVACTNLLDAMKSSYWWENDIVMDNEVIVILKTIAKYRAKIIKTISQHHSYEVPCVIFMPILDGHPDFLQWIEEQTGE